MRTDFLLSKLPNQTLLQDSVGIIIFPVLGIS